MEVYNSLNDPKLNELIDTLIEMRNLHQELYEEQQDLGYQLADLDMDDDWEEETMYELEDLSTSLQDDMDNTEENMKQLIAEYASLNQK